jgi:hypothetical protein
MTTQLSSLAVRPGGLTSGMIVAGYVSGSTFRLLSDQASAAIQTAAEAAQVAAETAQAAAEAAAAGAAGVYPVADRTALKALDTSAQTVAYLKEPGREGTFKWNSSDFSAKVTADIAEGIYVAPSSDTTGASGAWVRQGGWAIAGADARWFGYAADYDDSDGSGTENGAILAAALAVPNVARVLCPAGMARMDGLEIPKNKVVSGVRPTMQSISQYLGQTVHLYGWDRVVQPRCRHHDFFTSDE